MINPVNVSTGLKGLKDEQDYNNQTKSKNPAHPENQDNRVQDNKKETLWK